MERWGRVWPKNTGEIALLRGVFPLHGKGPFGASERVPRTLGRGRS